MNPRGEKFVSRMMMGGIACIVVGAGLFCLFLFIGVGQIAATRSGGSSGMAIAALGVILFVLGFVMVVWALVSGLKMSSGGGGKKGPRQLPEVFVASRFAINQVGEMIFSNFEFDAPGGKLYVQMKFPDGHTEEFRTAWGVFCQCGEGMRGAAMVNGSWLASFAPIMTKAAPLNNPEI